MTARARLAQLLADLRECGDDPLSYGQETHGELHLEALAELEAAEAGMREARKAIRLGVRQREEAEAETAMLQEHFDAMDSRRAYEWERAEAAEAERDRIVAAFRAKVALASKRAEAAEKQRDMAARMGQAEIDARMEANTRAHAAEALVAQLQDALREAEYALNGVRLVCAENEAVEGALSLRRIPVNLALGAVRAALSLGDEPGEDASTIHADLWNDTAPDGTGQDS